MLDIKLTEESLGYVTAEDPVNTDRRFLVKGSQNVFIDRNRKVRSANGYSRLGAANAASTPVRNAWTWFTSTGQAWMQRFYDDELEVWVSTLDGVALNTWYRVANAWSTTEIMRAAAWWDDTENLDFQIMVVGDDNLYRWNGAVAVAGSITVNTITKKGTPTFGQSRFYVSANRTLINVRTGVEYAYTGGVGTATLTGVTPDPTGDILENDVLIQKIVTNSNTPAADRNNHTIGVHENQLVVGSEDANEVYISKNTDYTSYTFSSPRVSGEGAILTLDGPSRGFGSLGAVLVAFAGENGIFRTEYEQITVSTTLAETLKIRKIAAGSRQGSFSADTVIQIGDSLIYLSNEPALRYIKDPLDLQGLDPRTLSNPIKPDFDAEDFTNAHAIWHRNAVYLCASVNSRTYVLEFVEDADGRVRRFWDPPQILPARAFSPLGSDLYGHSNAVPETYKLFDGFSGVNSSDEKLPIQAIAKFAYQNYGKRGLLKNFDLYQIEGEISSQTNDLLMTLNYDFEGAIQVVERTINSTDEGLLLGFVPSDSLAQQPLGQKPIGGSLTVPSDAQRFRVIFELAREDFHELQTTFETNEVDRYWAITVHGGNVRLSNRRAINIYR